MLGLEACYTGRDNNIYVKDSWRDKLDKYYFNEANDEFRKYLSNLIVGEVFAADDIPDNPYA